MSLVQETIIRRSRFGDIIMENAQLIFERNFSGRRDEYNDKGERYFKVVIPDAQLAQELAEEGWNIKVWVPKDPDEAPVHHLQVFVRFDKFPPKVNMITGNRGNLLGEENIANLDRADIKTIDIIINPSRWEKNKRSGIKAYLKEGFFVIEESPFADKYPDISW